MRFGSRAGLLGELVSSLLGGDPDAGGCRFDGTAKLPDFSGVGGCSDVSGLPSWVDPVPVSVGEGLSVLLCKVSKQGSSSSSRSPCVPLPRVWGVDWISGRYSGSSSRVQSRCRRRYRVLRLADAAIVALNQLDDPEYAEDARSHTAGWTVRPSAAMRSAVITVIQRARGLCRHLADAGCAVPPSGPCSYERGSSGGEFAFIRNSRIALPEPGTGGSVDMLQHLPPEVAREYSSESGAVRAVPPTADALDRVSPRVCIVPGDYSPLLCRMQAAGMVQFQDAEPKCVNGLFAVRKDDMWDRLIFDGRRCNMFFQEPPHVLLPTPEAFLGIELGPGEELFCGKNDVSNMYHHVRVPAWMSEYLGLPRVWSAEVGLDGPGRWVFPCLLTLPMGLSHAVRIAQVLHSAILCRALPPESRDILRLVSGIELGVYSSYIDDSGFLSSLRECAERCMRRGVEALVRVGFPCKLAKQMWPGSGEVTTLTGVSLRVDGCLLPAASKFAACLLAIRNLVTTGQATSRQVSSLIGSVVWFSLLARPVLSVLGAVYDFIQAGYRDPVPIPFKVVWELSTFVALSPCLVVDLHCSPANVVMASDASLTGGGVCYARISAAEYGVLREHSQKKGWTARLDAPELLDLPFPQSLVDLVDRVRWKTAISTKWRFQNSITLLEGAACLRALHWLACQPSKHFMRVPFFIDSQALLGGLVKGRSSSKRLRHILRRVASVCLSCQLRPLWLWVPSAHNPADAPSRGYS